jgi:hypothetical protein
MPIFIFKSDRQLTTFLHAITRKTRKNQTPLKKYQFGASPNATLPSI